MKDKVARERIVCLEDEIGGVLGYLTPKPRLHTHSIREHIECLSKDYEYLKNEISKVRDDLMRLSRILGYTKVTRPPSLGEVTYEKIDTDMSPKK